MSLKSFSHLKFVGLLTIRKGILTAMYYISCSLEQQAQVMSDGYFLIFLIHQRPSVFFDRAKIICTFHSKMVSKKLWAVKLMNMCSNWYA